MPFPIVKVADNRYIGMLQIEEIEVIPYGDGNQVVKISYTSGRGRELAGNAATDFLTFLADECDDATTPPPCQPPAEEEEAAPTSGDPLAGLRPPVAPISEIPLPIGRAERGFALGDEGDA